MVDDRYNVTQEEQEEIIKKFFSNENLKKFPPKQKQKLVVIREIAKHLDGERVYDEKN